MKEQNTNIDSQHGFSVNRAALHEIHQAIGRIRRRPRAAIRVIASGPERIRWYECTRCGGPGNLDGNAEKRCRYCGGPAIEREWVRPDIARAEYYARLRRQRRALETTSGNGSGFQWAGNDTWVSPPNSRGGQRQDDQNRD
jgi:hypothetical protein